jgi:hypothetical protein
MWETVALAPEDEVRVECEEDKPELVRRSCLEYVRMAFESFVASLVFSLVSNAFSSFSSL